MPQQNASAQQCIYSLHCVTPCCIYCTETEAVLQKTRKKRKVKFKVWRTGLAHRSRDVCYFRASFSSILHSMNSAWILLCQILADHPSSRGSSSTFLIPITFFNQMTLADSSDQLVTQAPTTFLYLSLHLYIWRGEYFLLPGRKNIAQLYVSRLP